MVGERVPMRAALTKRPVPNADGSPSVDCSWWARYLFDWQAYAIPTGMTYLKMLADAVWRPCPTHLHETRGRPRFSPEENAGWPKQRQERIRSMRLLPIEMRWRAPSAIPRPPQARDGARSRRARQPELVSHRAWTGGMTLTSTATACSAGSRPSTASGRCPAAAIAGSR